MKTKRTTPWRTWNGVHTYTTTTTEQRDVVHLSHDTSRVLANTQTERKYDLTAAHLQARLSVSRKEIYGERVTVCGSEQADWSGGMNNQKVKADKGKPRITLVPRQIVYDIARVREYGVQKYAEGGIDNWKQVEIERYKDALCRHLLAYLDDPDGVDEESGLPHLAHLATNVAFLCEMEKWRRDEKDM